MKLKLERLFIPYLIWPLFIWCFNNLLYLTIEKNRFGRMISFKELKLQIITGRMFFIQLWFIFNLLILSIFFFIISFLYGYIFMLILNLVSIICYLIQHFGDNYILYSQYKDCIAHSIGHLIISFPIAITAFTFNRNNLINYLENFGHIPLFFLILLIALFLFIFGKPNTYNGVDKNIFSLFIFYCFHSIPLNKYLKNNFKTIIYLLTSFTQGIYCLHNIIKFYVFRVFKLSVSLFSCFFIYFICYIISFFGKKIFFRNKLKYLFI